MKKKILFIILFIIIVKVSANESFPSEYQNKIDLLKEKYPNWQFKIFYTGLDFNEAVDNEFLDNKNLVPLNSSDQLKGKESLDYNINTNTFIEKDRNWVKANKLVISYFMNPINFLNEKHIMQFELLGYDEELHTMEGVEAILRDTFMYQRKINYLNMVGDLVETDDTYSSVIMEAAKEANISPYYLASKIRQEVGTNGSGSTSGNYKNYTGVYNFYNIGATDGKDPIDNGLLWALTDTTYDRPWTSPQKSIIGGAKYIANAYISKGQNIGYLQKFNVNKNSYYPLYTHQYMSNVAGATSEAALKYNASLDILNSFDTKIFYIPIYNNMPDMNADVSLNKGVNIQTGSINTDNVYLRDGPGISYNFFLKLSKFDKVNILKGFRTDSIYDINYFYYPYWYKVNIVKDGYKYTGYICSKYVDIDSSKDVYVNDTYKLDYKVNPSNEIVYFDSSDMKIASVDNGIVKFKKSGKVTINIYVGSKLESISFNVKNKNIYADNIKIDNNLSLDVGDSKKINYTITPSNTTNKQVIWKSSNNNVSISNGIVKGINPGNSIITATIDGKKAYCNVKIGLNTPYITSVNSNSYNSLKINFNRVNGASGYYIYRANSYNSNYTYIGSTNNNYFINYNLTTNKTYYYKIRVYKDINGKRNFYNYSNVRSGNPILNSPNINLSKYGKNKVRITYNKISGASGYYIYRANSYNGKYSLIKTTKANSYINTVKIKRTYYYKIRAYRIVNKKRIFSKYSSIKSIKR